jgi:hypothetical protein
MERMSRTATVLRSLLLAAVVLTWMGASGEARAAKPDPLCEGLSGVARGLCSAASALGCGESTKHQRQCDMLADKYEQQTGLPPPWEEPVYPSQSATLAFDFDAFDLETGTLCEDALVSAVECNAFDATSTIRPPNDFWIAYMSGETNPAMLVHNLDCGEGSSSTPAIAFLEGTPFGSVDSSILSTIELGTDPVVAPLDPDDTVVLRTCDGFFFKIGNMVCNDGTGEGQCQSGEVGLNTVRVDYERLEFVEP